MAAVGADTVGVVAVRLVGGGAVIHPYAGSGAAVAADIAGSVLDGMSVAVVVAERVVVVMDLVCLRLFVGSGMIAGGHNSAGVAALDAVAVLVVAVCGFIIDRVGYDFGDDLAAAAAYGALEDVDGRHVYIIVAGEFDEGGPYALTYFGVDELLGMSADSGSGLGGRLDGGFGDHLFVAAVPADAELKVVFRQRVARADRDLEVSAAVVAPVDVQVSGMYRMAAVGVVSEFGFIIAVVFQYSVVVFAGGFESALGAHIVNVIVALVIGISAREIIFKYLAAIAAIGISGVILDIAVMIGADGNDPLFKIKQLVHDHIFGMSAAVESAAGTFAVHVDVAFRVGVVADILAYGRVADAAVCAVGIYRVYGVRVGVDIEIFRRFVPELLFKYGFLGMPAGVHIAAAFAYAVDVVMGLVAVEVGAGLHGSDGTAACVADSFVIHILQQAVAAFVVLLVDVGECDGFINAVVIAIEAAGDAAVGEGIEEVVFLTDHVLLEQREGDIPVARGAVLGLVHVALHDVDVIVAVVGVFYVPYGAGGAHVPGMFAAHELSRRAADAAFAGRGVVNVVLRALDILGGQGTVEIFAAFRAVRNVIFVHQPCVGVAVEAQEPEIFGDEGMLYAAFGMLTGDEAAAVGAGAVAGELMGLNLGDGLGLRALKVLLADVTEHVFAAQDGIFVGILVDGGPCLAGEVHGVAQGGVGMAACGIALVAAQTAHALGVDLVCEVVGVIGVDHVLGEHKAAGGADFALDVLACAHVEQPVVGMLLIIAPQVGAFARGMPAAVLGVAADAHAVNEVVGLVQGVLVSGAIEIVAAVSADNIHEDRSGAGMAVRVIIDIFRIFAQTEHVNIVFVGAGISGSIAAVNAAAVLVGAALIGLVDDAVGHARPVQTAGIAVVVGPFLGNMVVGIAANIYIVVMRYGYGVGGAVALMAGAGGGCGIAATAAIYAVAVLESAALVNHVA